MSENAQAYSGNLPDLQGISGSSALLSLRALAVWVCFKEISSSYGSELAWKLKGIHTRYYEPRLHAGVFALPVYVEELLEDVE